MIEQLSIKNFKSIKDLKIPCKKLNVFIGEPNSGKSNIIEALALQSQNSLGGCLNRDGRCALAWQVTGTIASVMHQYR